jgi:dipeptidyl aminopeptidase/acylaminoacyl peptidase
MKRFSLFLAGLFLVSLATLAQDTYVAPGDNLVVDGVPKIPASLVETAGRYGSYRRAGLADWHPVKREMLIATRFAETSQLHLLAMPGGERQQLTFYPDAVTNGKFHAHGGDYIVFSKDVGGGEWFQLFRYDMKTGDVTLLTDGKARNLMGPWSSSGDQIAYISTRRTGKDTDLWVMNPADAKTDHLLLQLEGGGWQPLDWSPDDKKILLLEELSINESYLWLVDTVSGKKTELTPRNAAEKVSYGTARFSKDGKGIYVTTDKDSEFHRLAYLDLATKQPTYLTTSIHWDVETFDLTQDGKYLAFVTNEEGLTVLHVRDTTNGKEMPLPKLPAGVLGGVRWHRNGQELGFSLNSSRGPGDCYSLDVTTGKFERWTTSETAVKTESFPQSELIHWKSFDGKMISGFLYKPPAKFAGKRPVLVVIHGGPEGQSQPTFLGRSNYLLNELGIADLSERTRVHRLRKNIFVAGQRIQARRHLQGYQCSVRLDRVAAGTRRRAHRRDRRQLRRAHDPGGLHIL